MGVMASVGRLVSGLAVIGMPLAAQEAPKSNSIPPPTRVVAVNVVAATLITSRSPIFMSTIFALLIRASSSESYSFTTTTTPCSLRGVQGTQTLYTSVQD